MRQIAVDSSSLIGYEAGYWERAGLLRAHVLATGRRARMADALIAQSCIDHDVPLVTADADFRSFTAHGLRLVEQLAHPRVWGLDQQTSAGWALGKRRNAGRMVISTYYLCPPSP